MKILFMCVANSARSQIAEGLARNILGPDHEIQSAGSKPQRVNPLAIEVLKEVGIDISKNTSKTVKELKSEFLKDIDYIITLCTEEVCPVLLSNAKKLHWPLPDPASVAGSIEEQMQAFRKIRDGIQERLQGLFSSIYSPSRKI